MRLVLALLACFAATPAFADAVTYTGALGGRAIVLELTEPRDGAVAGRFAFLDTGESVPLKPRSHSETRFVLVQEGRCTPDICGADENGVAEGPVDAVWDLTLEGSRLTGTHRPADGSASLPIEAVERARRSFSGDPTPLTLFENTAASVLTRADDIDDRNAAYELALSDIPLAEARRETVGDAEIAYVVDPRSQFAFPRVLRFADGSATDAVNAILARRHAVMTISALDCLSGVYAGFGANRFGSLADYDSETVELTYASPLLVSWYEAGSLYCGGAHPYNHFDSYTYEVASGRPFDLSRVFAGWETRDYSGAAVDLEEARQNPDSYLWQPGPSLIDYARRGTARELPADEAEFDDVCLEDSALRNHLTIRFKAGPNAVFTLAGFPHVLGLCNGDLRSVPLADMREVLTEEAADYLPELAR